MPQINFLCFILYLSIISRIYPASIELSNYSEIELKEGYSEFFYFNFIPKANFRFNSLNPYIFIKFTNYQEIDINILINREQYYCNLPKENGEWIDIPIKKSKYENKINLVIHTIKKNIKMIFIDPTKLLKMNSSQFLNLNFITNKLLNEPYPLIFEVTVDKKVSFAFKEEINSNFDKFTKNNIGKNNFYRYEGLNKSNNLTETNNTFKFTLNPYFENNFYYFRKIKILYYMEEIFIKNNTFRINKFTENNLFLLNSHNYKNISFYINDNSGFLHQYYSMFLLSKNNFDNIIDNIDTTQFKDITNAKINFMNNKNNSDYLIININNKMKKEEGYILFFNNILEIQNDGTSDIKKGTHALIYIYMSYVSKGILLSSSKNMKLLKSNNEFTNEIIIDTKGETIIYLNSSNENTKFVHNFLYMEHNFINNKFIIDNDIKKFLGGNDIYYTREIWNKEKTSFYSLYFFDIKEKYYLYTKKYFGIGNLYKYKPQLTLDTRVQDFMQPYNYYDEKLYSNENNHLLILTGTQFFSFNINFGTFFDFFIQKANDTNYIEKIEALNNGAIKLLNSMKKYYIKFELNHLIKLDNNFLDAKVTFIDTFGKKYILNKINKIINIKGNNFTVESNKNALIYFYEKIEDVDDKIILEFNKYNAGKNQKINLTNKYTNYDLKIAVAKDFGFKNCYPMVNPQQLEIYTISPKQTITLYIENYYDFLEDDIFESEGEKYFIYLFEVIKDNKYILLNKNKLEISSLTYFDSLIKNNKLGFDIISKGESNLILKTYDKSNYNYQFLKCSNNNIYFELNQIYENNITKKEKQTIDTNKYFPKSIDGSRILINSFESKDEFLFIYDFSKYQYKYDEDRIHNYGIKYLNKNQKNILTIGFTMFYTSFSEYYIIIAKKNNINNLYSFSNPCYLTKLLMSNSNYICYKKVYHEQDYPKYLIFEEIDINKLIQDKKKNDNDEYIINIISHNLALFNHLYIYTPVIYNEKEKIKGVKKLKFFDKIILTSEKGYFMYEHLTDDKLILHIETFAENKIKENVMIVTRDNEIIKKLFYSIGDILEIILDKKGTYFFEFFKREYVYYKENNILFIYPFNIMIEEIDLSKNNYSGFLTNNIYNIFLFKVNYNLPYYKVNNLKEDKLVYFIYDDNLNEYKDSPFIICENKKDECVYNTITYNFLKGKEYSIYINKINNQINDPNEREKINKINYYSFFPILQNTILHIKEEGHLIIDTPKILIIEKNKDFFFDIFNIEIYFVSENEINKSYYITKVKYKDLNNINIYSFYFDKDSIYRKIVLIPNENDKLKHIFITNERLSFDSNQIEVKAGTNCLINLSNSNDNKNEQKIFENYFMTFISPEKNIKFVSLEKNLQNEKLIFNHQWEKYLYIDKSNKDIYINKEIYDTKFTFFSILNDNTISNFIESKKIYFNKRLNTNFLPINDYINLYIDKLNIKYNLYIKKYYGPIKLYESPFILNNYSNIGLILSKPINNLKKKKSIFNKLIHLEKNQIITGYLSSNSLLDIYLEKDDNNADIYLEDFKNRKYLKKGIEYKFHFNLNHLIKLEQPQLNTEIIIYNNDIKIILNEKNQTGILFGTNFKIKSNEDSMVYFYPKTKKFQQKIEPNKGEVIKIIRNSNLIHIYYIDFGFEGFEPPNMEQKYNMDYIFIDNIYDKLEIKLTKGEYLYIYYDSLRDDPFEINYINNNIILKNYIDNFILVRNNKTSNIKYINPTPIDNKKSVKIQINQCDLTSSSNLVEITYADSKESFYNNIKNLKYKLSSTFLANFTLESENDYILSYFYLDIKDEFISEKMHWEKDRIQNKNLTINDINIINNEKIKIKFNANYKNSLTKYMIIITPEEKNITFDKLKNPCFLTELINNKGKNLFIEEIYDIGDNNFIEIDIDLSNLNLENKNCTVNIISQELRHEKYLKFYEPKFFYYQKKIYTNIIKNILLIFGFILFLSLMYVNIKKSNIKNKLNIYRNSKIKNANEENLGTELNEDKDFLNYNINN